MNLSNIDPEATAPADSDQLAGFDVILDSVAERERRSVGRLADELKAGEDFLEAFATACRAQVRPAMEAVVQRLRQRGGGGLIEEHPGGEPRFRYPSVVLWMSLDGDIVGQPRPDREPYLQLEAHVDERKVQVYEGDRWRGGGGNLSGPVGMWGLSEITVDRVIEELLSIARRAAQ